MTYEQFLLDVQRGICSMVQAQKPEEVLLVTVNQAQELFAAFLMYHPRSSVAVYYPTFGPLLLEQFAVMWLTLQEKCRESL